MTLRQDQAAAAGRIESFELLIADDKLALGALLAKLAERQAQAKAAVEFAMQKCDEFFAEMERELTQASNLREEEFKRMIGDEPKPAPVPVFDISADDSPAHGDPVPLRTRRAAQ